MPVHSTALESSYRAVGDLTWVHKDFLIHNLKSSRNLFTEESLRNRQPQPKALEVYALLSGLPFPKDFIQPLVDVQRSISAILGGALHYWVKPVNLAVEHCVFKWPDDIWQEQHRDSIEMVLESMNMPSFSFRIGGIQVNSDGCVVAKGFDEGDVIFKIRNRLKQSLPFLPAKQSGWAHVPLGRILEPINEDNFAKLKNLMQILRAKDIASTEISSLNLIHEKRWYMEERTTLATYSLVTPSNLGTHS
nr:hypothetical protein [Cytophagales bacterium]